MDKELWNLDSHQTWTYIFLSKKLKAIGSKWVFKVKCHTNCLMKMYKGCLVTQGFYQVHEID